MEIFGRKVSPMDTYAVDLEAMGKRIRGLRLSQKKTQEAFAEMIHISTSYLALLEQGKRQASLDVVAPLAKKCQVSADYLLFGEEVDLSTANENRFHSLCQQYSEQEIDRGLDMMNYYLNLESRK